MKLLNVVTNKVQVVAGFPGVGKTKLVSSWSNPNVSLLDSDSSTFDKQHFPDNYVDYIEKQVDMGSYILSSTHASVLDELTERFIPFILVYPDISLKDEYLERYRTRGSSDTFVQMMNDKWDDFITQCEVRQLCQKVKLSSGEYILNGLVRTRLLNVVDCQ